MAVRYLPNLAIKHTRPPPIQNVRLAKPYAANLNMSVERLGPGTSRNAISRYAHY